MRSGGGVRGQRQAEVLRPARVETERTIEPPERDGLAMLLERQQRAKLPSSMGCARRRRTEKETSSKIGISEVVDQGSEVVVLFSMVNPQAHAMEILPPQIQLAGKLKKGFPVKRSHWGTSQQLAVRISGWRDAVSVRVSGPMVSSCSGVPVSSNRMKRYFCRLRKAARWTSRHSRPSDSEFQRSGRRRTMANNPRSENPLLRDEQLHGTEHAGDIRQASSQAESRRPQNPRRTPRIPTSLAPQEQN